MLDLPIHDPVVIKGENEGLQVALVLDDLKKLMKLLMIQGNKPNLISVAVPLFGGVFDVWPAEVGIREH